MHLPNCVLNCQGASLQRKWFFLSLRWIASLTASLRFQALPDLIPQQRQSYFQHYLFIQKWWLFTNFEILVPALPQPHCMRPWDHQHWHLIIWRLIPPLPYRSLSWLSCRSKLSLTWTANKNNAALGYIRFTELRSSIWWQFSLNRMSQDMLKMWAILGISCVQSKEIARRKPSTESVDMSVYNFVRFLIFCYNLIGLSVCLKNRRNYN